MVRKLIKEYWYFIKNFKLIKIIIKYQNAFKFCSPKLNFIIRIKIENKILNFLNINYNIL